MITTSPITDEWIKNNPVSESTEAKERPRTLMPTPLRLSRAQEDALMQTIKDTFTEVKGKMEAAGTLPDTPELVESFLGSREKFYSHFNNNVKYREKLGGIYAITNITLNLSRVFCRRMIAKGISYFFGTDPWFAAYPEGIEDSELAATIERHARWKIKQTPCNQVMRQAVERAFIIGEAVVKTIQRDEIQHYRSKTEILVDADGKPILTSEDEGSDYIFKDDAWVDDPAASQQVEDAAQEHGLIPRMGKQWVKFKEQIFGPAGTPQVLKKDPTIRKPAALFWKTETVDRTLRLFAGPKSELVPFKHFICPLDAPSVDDAPFVGQPFDESPMWLAEILNGYDPSQDNLSEIEQAVIVENALKVLKASYDGTTPLANNPNKSGEPYLPRTLRLLECHLKFDAEQTGQSRNITAIVDRENWTPIYYNYTANVTATGRRPFKVVRAIEVAGCWWGVGIMQMFGAAQEFIDKCVNRIEGRNAESGRVTFWNPFLTVEGQRDKNLKLNHGKTYMLKDQNVDPAKVLSYVTLPPLVEDTYKIMELVMQVMQQESGVITADANQTSGLDQTKLATGIRNIERAGNELFGLYLQALEPGLTEVLQDNLMIIYARMDRKEIFSYLNGNARVITDLSPEDVRGMVLNVNLLLTRQKSEQQLEQALKGIEILREYYLQPPQVQERLKQPTIQALKALEWKDADQAVEPMMLEAAPAAAGAPGAPAALPAKAPSAVPGPKL
jgi:hypothetical protein